MKTYHTILIGGGINNLVCASILAKKGKSVLVIERTKNLGGCIQSMDVEGCVIDTLSMAYPLFVTSPSYAELKKDLEAEGISFVSTKTPTASVLSNKKYSILTTDRETNKNHFNSLFEGDGNRFREQIAWVEHHAELLFTFLGQEIRSFKMIKFLAYYIWKNGISTTIQHIGSYLSNVRNNIPVHFKSSEIQALLAPWVLHTGFSPDSPFSATMAKIIAFTLEAVSLPLVQGGSYKIVTAFKNIIEKNGGMIHVETHVEEILLENKKAIGVATKQENFYAEHVVASVTPTQLYKYLIKDKKNIPIQVSQDAENFKYGMGNMQIHIVLNESPQWFDSALNPVTYVHLTDGISNIDQSIAQAKAQQLPEQCTIAIGQPTVTDPSRATNGKSVLWIQIPDCPNFPIKDASGKLTHLCNGEWTTELKEAYADTIVERISTLILNIKRETIYRSVISPKDLSEMNINLVNGDPYGGHCDIDQYLLFRPLKSTKNHETPIKNLFHSGASTHPGPGLGGGSGFLIAQKLLNS